MDQTSSALFQLLRISLSRESETIPQFADWVEVMKLAISQEICGVCFEAFDFLPPTQRPDVYTLLKWLGKTNLIEVKYEEHLKLAKKLTSKWSSNGISTMVFKGLAHSRYYHNPSHRSFGDFDCYQFGKIAEGNRIAAEYGAIVDDHWYKHSKIQYKSLTVENHRYFTAVRSSKKAKALNDYILKNIGDGSNLQKYPDSEILLPPVEVEGLFMLYHSLRHFLEEGISVRHFYDWACWMKANQELVHWDSFYQRSKEFGLDGFADVMNVIISSYLGVNIDLSYLQHKEKSKLLADKVVQNALYDDTSIHNKGKGVWYERWHLITNSFNYSWKYREVAGYSMIGYLWGYVKGFIFRNEED